MVLYKLLTLALNCCDLIGYRLIQTEFVLAFGGLKLQLHDLHLTSKSAATNTIMGMISFIFILQI